MSTDPTSKATYPQTGGSKLEHHDLPSHTARSLTMTIGASTSSSDGGAANIGPSDTQTLPEAATSAKAIKMAIHPTDTPLNPIARPFVPRNSIEPPLPPNPQTTAQAKPNSCDPQEPSWNGAFVSGCLEDPSAKWNVARRASQVVCSPSFSEKDLGLLTRKFCRRAHIQETGRGSESLAMFAAEVHRTVNVFYGAHQAFLFRQKMATYAVSTFVDKWDVVCLLVP
ncbi:uncharacterized protein BT62DRAFT_934297 [Guyanagaster necrorhizus]|uniref:Uncharacterized protein n=1 Tax=Guyanagaster necrorhizus TaxID=856835 RepID=A0A9P8AQL7_9AGAR|nr:uncharacterized protein BT62DRAFT_934297 [Guyanagaster necrorhizus MCA 3950]KAG7444125.1 hypothetical protein BT62DRAFT_934297 [Guyanagaster necrorhizus MCA 3950]